MKYEVIKPFNINQAEFYVGDEFASADELGPWFSTVLSWGCLRAKSEKREKEEKAEK